MRAIILAAGRGSRMGKLTADRPKCLIEVSGKSLLNRQINALQSGGIRQIAIVTGYKYRLLYSYHFKKFYNSRWAETNIVASLACATEWLSHEPCIVSYSDIFYDSNAVRSLINCSDSLAITYDPNWLEHWEKRFENPLVDAETFKLNPDNTISAIGEKPEVLDEIEGQFMGLIRIEPQGWLVIEEILSRLTSTERDEIQMTTVLNLVIQQGSLGVHAKPYTGEWGEIDSEKDLQLYQSLFSNS